MSTTQSNLPQQQQQTTTQKERDWDKTKDVNMKEENKQQVSNTDERKGGFFDDLFDKFTSRFEDFHKSFFNDYSRIEKELENRFKQYEE